MQSEVTAGLWRCADKKSRAIWCRSAAGKVVQRSVTGPCPASYCLLQGNPLKIAGGTRQERLRGLQYQMQRLTATVRRSAFWLTVRC